MTWVEARLPVYLRIYKRKETRLVEDDGRPMGKHAVTLGSDCGLGEMSNRVAVSVSRGFDWKFGQKRKADMQS